VSVASCRDAADLTRRRTNFAAPGVQVKFIRRSSRLRLIARVGIVDDTGVIDWTHSRALR
jgi:hypothetical protein